MPLDKNLDAQEQINKLLEKALDGYDPKKEVKTGSKAKKKKKNKKKNLADENAVNGETIDETAPKKSAGLSNRARKIIATVSISIAAFFLLFFLALTLPAFAFVRVETRKTYPNHNYMRSLFEKNPHFRNLSVSSVAMLGSADSFSYGIGISSKPNPLKDSPAKGWLLNSLLKGYLVRNTRRQAHDIRTQLYAGVRYIETDISFVDGTYYVSNDMLCLKLADAITPVLTFLGNQTGEWVVFNIKNYYKGTSSWDNLYSFIDSVKVNGVSMFNYINFDITNHETFSNFDDVKVKHVTDNGLRSGILMVINEEVTGLFGDISQLSYGKVYNKERTSTTVDALTEESDGEHQFIYARLNGIVSEPTVLAYNKRLRVNNLYLSQTSNLGGQIKTAFDWSVIDLAARTNAGIIKKTNFTATWILTMPIAVFDYATCTQKDFNEGVIYILYEYNLASIVST